MVLQVDCEWSLRPEIGKKVSFTAPWPAAWNLRSWVVLRTEVYLDDKGAGAKDVVPVAPRKYSEVACGVVLRTSLCHMSAFE